MKKLLKLLWRRPSSIRIALRRPSRTLRLSEWQASENLVAEGQKLLGSPLLILALDILRNESPVNFGLPDLGVSASDRLVHQAKTEGYHLCLNNLEALGTLKLGEQPVEATFESPSDELQPTGSNE